METTIFEKQTRLRKFPPGQLLYILYRRLAEQGPRATALWVKDKVVRRMRGYSPADISRVAPHLFVGGQQRVKGLAAMRELGISAVVNMREESDDASRGVALDAYLWLPTTDDAAPSAEALKQGIAFIAESIDAGRGVYIHCGAGVGRAPTMAAAYLVHKGATAEAAWETIRRARPFIRPTPPQVEAIEALAASAASAETAALELRTPGSQAREAQTLAPGKRAGAVDRAPSGETAEGDLTGLARREQLAYERISGDPALTGDLTDDEAQILLAWSRQEVHRLVAATAGKGDAEAWDTLDGQLRQLRLEMRAYAQQGAGDGTTLRALLAERIPRGEQD